MDRGFDGCLPSMVAISQSTPWMRRLQHVGRTEGGCGGSRMCQLWHGMPSLQGMNEKRTGG